MRRGNVARMATVSFCFRSLDYLEGRGDVSTDLIAESQVSGGDHR